MLTMVVKLFSRPIGPGARHQSRCAINLKRLSFVSLFLLAFLGFSCGGVKPVLNKTYPDRYSLELPDKWRKKGKLLNAITDILPVAVKELEGKDFCFDCNAAYTVQFRLTDAEMVSNGGYVGVYRFRSAFSVYDDKKKPIARFTVVDPEKDDVLFYNGSTGVVNHGTSTTQLNYETNSRSVSSYQPNFDYSDSKLNAVNTKKSQQVNLTNLLKYTEKKIYEIRDMVQAKK